MGRVSYRLERAVGVNTLLEIDMPNVELQARVREQQAAKKQALVKLVYRGVAYNSKNG